MMLLILSVVAGMLNALTAAQNGELAEVYGKLSSVAIVHLVGLIVVLCLYLFKRKTLPPKQQTAPWMYLGGVIGVGTVLFLNTAYTGVTVAAIMALSLLGQTVTSIAVDHFGLFGAQRKPFARARLSAVAAVAAGAAVMIFPMGDTSPVAALCALGSGVTIVAARTVNGRLAVRQGAMRSTVMNYVTGFVTVTLLALLIGRGEPFWTGVTQRGNLFMYLGGAFGVVLIMLLNLTVPRLSALSSTMLQFTGQMLMSLLVDTVLTGAFSWRNLAGGALVAAGLLLDAAIGKRKTIS